MARMIRKQIYIEPEQEKELKRRSQESGLSEAELIRKAITDALDRAGRRQRAIEAWQNIDKFIREKRTFDVPQTDNRGWTREELYEERLKRFE